VNRQAKIQSRQPASRKAIRKPLILISPDFDPSGVEFDDPSLSLSMRYPEAVVACGGVPVVMTHTESAELIAEYVRRSDGVLLTGGEDLNPELYGPGLDKALKAKAKLTADGGRRDLFELLLLEEIFRQRRPLLAICRGHQLLNVALGGTLWVDLPSQKPTKINHRQLRSPCKIVHSVRLTRGSLLAKIAKNRTLGVNSTHHQAVNRVAPGLRAVARSTDGVVEGLEESRSGSLLPFLLSIQFHPERMMQQHASHRAIIEAFIQASMASQSKNL
jgi:putative glutamine amidotransferase